MQRREEVMQYIYRKYGRDRAPRTAAVATCRPRSALREAREIVIDYHAMSFTLGRHPLPKVRCGI
ncbi:hypothetical protein ABXL43_33310 [Burkholderia sola]